VSLPARYGRGLIYHPQVFELPVIGKSDVEWGEIVVAFIVGKEEDSTKLDCSCMDNVAGLLGQFSTLSRARFNALIQLITCYSDPRST
jgi:acyl-coenzyme A synthetase/AMP-(fatty) acid ligase